MTDSIVIVAAKRTPVGSFQGNLSSVAATKLGSHAIKAVLETSKHNPDKIDEVIMGCVLPAGLGQAPARQATLGAGLPNSVNAMTVNKVCGSGLKSVILAYDSLRLDNTRIIIAGGMESMTNAPYLSLMARGGYRLGHGKVYDHMMMDGLEDAYNNGCAMGVFADATAEKYKFTREEQDAFAINSGQKALDAQKNNLFKDEIAPISVKVKKDTVEISIDEPPSKLNFAKVASLPPAFTPNGTATAASSSSISDGAAVVMLMNESKAKEHGLKPLAKIIGHATHSQAPEWFTTAPIGAVQKLLEKCNWTIDSVDLFEINEAFAVVPMAVMRDMKIDPSKVNVNGGACALGHPIGASGARLLVTLVHALQQRKLTRGIATLCIGGGEAVAIAIERC